MEATKPFVADRAQRRPFDPEGFESGPSDTCFDIPEPQDLMMAQYSAPFNVELALIFPLLSLFLIGAKAAKAQAKAGPGSRTP